MDCYYRKMPHSWHNYVYVQSYVQESQMCHKLNPNCPHYLTTASHLHKPSGFNYVYYTWYPQNRGAQISTNLEATSKF